MTVALSDTPVARWVALLGPTRQLAEVLSMTEFVPKDMRGKPDSIAAAILYGDELGLDPMQALASINVVEGRPTPSAELKRALILQAGHSFTVHEMTGTRVRVSGLRQGLPEADRLVVEWTTDMARAAGLANKQNWRNYPRAMLMARATDDLARAMFPDVVKGLGDADPVLLADPSTGEILEPLEGPEPPPRKAIQRARKPRTPTVAPVADDNVELPPPATGEATRPPVNPDELDDTPHVHRFGPDGVCPDCGVIHTEQVDTGGTPPPGMTPVPRAEAPVAPPVPPDPFNDPAQMALPTEVADDDEPVRPPPHHHDFGIDGKCSGCSAIDPRRRTETPPPSEPEQPAEDVPVPGHVPRISAGPLKAVNTALTKELGTSATPDERHSMLSAVTGRTIESSKDLTRAEGYDVLGFLARVTSGQATYDMDPTTGAITVNDAALEPPEDMAP